MNPRQPKHTVENYASGLLNQDESSIRAIYDNYLPGIKSFILANSGKSEDAEDVFHDAMIVIYRKLKDNTFELNCSFHTFLYSIAKNLWLKRLRRKKKESGVTIEEAVVSTTESVYGINFEEQERLLLFREKFKLLGKDCRKLLRLFFDKTPMDNIARQMGYKSDGYARKRKFKCKEKLVELIKKDNRYEELKL
ncbi:MAG: sigma-70 family RNA polymerase sigma factor [Bacteroidetes bacterium]|nr:sigma-70 family RNA polymerase sigma factor [Bacteroidota bacterium]